VDVGDEVKEGDVLARLRLPVLEKELEQERAKLDLFSSHTTEMSRMERELAENERAFIAEQRQLIEARIESVRTAADARQQKSAGYIAEQRTNLETARTLTGELEVALSDRYDAVATLAEEGLTSASFLVDPQSQLIAARLGLAELDVKAQELELAEIVAQEEYDAKQDLIKDLHIKLNELGLREMAVTRRLREDELENTSDRETILRRIDELATQLENESRVLSVNAGRILEITASPGQLVTIGERLGKMEIEDRSAELMTLAYFRVKDGKKIQAGDRLRTSPSTVEQERYGLLLGTVVSVSDYPVTTKAAAHQIGDLETARTLLGGETRIEVVANLEREGSELVWTSGTGPEGFTVTAGTTAEVRVTIEEIAPIVLVLPFLKSLMGGR
jgi:HlyD family secretion protein